MNDLRLAFVYSPGVETLTYPPDCPFKTQRVGETRRRLISFGLLSGPDRVEVASGPATAAELQRIHTAHYLDVLQRASQGDYGVEALHCGIGREDTPVFPAMFDYGALACGAGLTAVERLLAGRADIVFNLLGGFHHAHAAHAGGFCYLNDVALACDALAGAGKRVVCLDVDAHHGDGTQALFYERDDVMTISMHESGRTLFPWGGFENEIGIGRGLGFNVNIPLPADTYDEAFLLALRTVALPLLEAHNPDVIVVELGMDILAGDPLTHLSMTNNVVVELMLDLLQLNKPLLIAGGGGYHLEHTVRGWALAWRACADGEEADEFSMGLGGVMMGSSEWAGGLRDHERIVLPEQRRAVESELSATLASVRELVFPFHGLPVPERPVEPGAPVICLSPIHNNEPKPQRERTNHG
jgi:acetoin utilization protein AcuC